MVYGITSKYGATRWSTSDINMCGRQKDMLAFVGMGYKGVDCIPVNIWCDHVVYQYDGLGYAWVI